MYYRFVISDPVPQLFACSLQPSVRAPGRQICISENGLALVVEPSGAVRDLRPGEEADSPWCWADLCGDPLVNAGSVVLLGSPTRGGGGLGPMWPPVMRSPLPPFPAPVDYKTVLPFTPPAGRDLYFYRGQFCGLRLADAPIVPGSNAANPSCIMACLLDNYPPQYQDEFLADYADDGNTHLQRSLGHALGYGHSIDEYIALSKKARSQYGLLCDHWLIANEFPGFRFDQDASFWGPKLDPYIDRLLDAGVIDCACPSWQMDQVMMGDRKSTR